MKLQIFVEIDDNEEETCGRNCPFLEDDTCLLFNRYLEETVLPKGYSWQDDTEPTRQRCHRCTIHGTM
jgi:hypothetical protein